MKRLSQALCRLRLNTEVSQEDVEEAIRLTHSSKASLYEDSTSSSGYSGNGGQKEDAISAIFGIIRDHAIQSRNGQVSFMQVQQSIDLNPFQCIFKSMAIYSTAIIVIILVITMILIAKRINHSNMTTIVETMILIVVVNAD